MGERTGIAWTNATWNPVRGCERVSEGCRNCYAEVLAARHSYEGGWGHEIAHYVGGKPRWTGVIETSARHLEAPLKWKAPRRVFVNSMSDLFHERVPMDFIDKIYAVMAMSSRHTFQILTKRPERMLSYLTRKDITDRIGHAEFELAGTGKRTAIMVDSYAGPVHRHAAWPLLNVWHGVSAEDQATFDERVEILGQVPTAVRFVSAEPLLDWIDTGNAFDDPPDDPPKYSKVHWVIIGGESGANHRPMDIEAARSLIQQCQLLKVPVFVKQDSGPRPGLRGRFTAEEWAMKDYPA